MAKRVFVTLQMLENSGACYDQKELFKKTFGTKAAITGNNIRKACDAGVDVNYLFELFPELGERFEEDTEWKKQYHEREAMRYRTREIYSADDFIEIDLQRILRYFEEVRNG